MCEVLLRVVDKINPDHILLDALCTKVGDVIVVVENGWSWGIEEKSNPEWKIIAIPDMSVAEALTFTEPDDSGTVLVPRKRNKGVNFAKLPKPIEDALNAPRSGDGIDYTLNKTSILKYVEVKVLLEDPAAL